MSHKKILSPHEMHRTLCIFCGKELTGEYFPDQCDCDEAEAAYAAWHEERQNDPDYKPPMTQEEYDEAYPMVFHQEMKSSDGTIVGVEVRQVEDHHYMVITKGFPGLDGEDDPKHCLDMDGRDAECLATMLVDYKTKHCRPYFVTPMEKKDG